MCVCFWCFGQEDCERSSILTKSSLFEARKESGKNANCVSWQTYQFNSSTIRTSNLVFNNVFVLLFVLSAAFFNGLRIMNIYISLSIDR